MNGNSTSIHDLPNTDANITLNSKPVQNNFNQSTMSELVSGLQQASTAGATQLNSRDISQSTDGLANDIQTRPNYIPDDGFQQNPQMQQKYIEEDNDAIEEYRKKVYDSEKLSEFYNDMQTPLFLAVLYFILQLPIIKEYLFLYLPFLFTISINQTALQKASFNIYGLTFVCTLFGILSYFFIKLTQ